MKRKPITAGNSQMNSDRLTIDAASQYTMTKQQMIDAINKTFPDKECAGTNKIAIITETKMRDGRTMQTITFGIPLDHYYK